VRGSATFEMRCGTVDALRFRGSRLQCSPTDCSAVIKFSDVVGGRPTLPGLTVKMRSPLVRKLLARGFAPKKLACGCAGRVAPDQEDLSPPSTGCLEASRTGQ